MSHFLKKYKSPTNTDFPTEFYQLCQPLPEEGYEIVKIKVNQDGNDLKPVEGFAIDVL